MGLTRPRTLCCRLHDRAAHVEHQVRKFLKEFIALIIHFNTFFKALLVF